MNQPNIPTIISVAQISEYLASQDIRSANVFTAKPADLRRPKLLAIERFGLEFMYNNYPSNANLTSVANYVYSLCGPYAVKALAIIANLTSSAPTITNPANQNITVGNSATFGVSVTSSLSFTVAWYRNGVLIPGATGLSYTLPIAQLTDSGSTFHAVATDAVGRTATSNSATLTVTAILQGQVYYGNTDFSTQLGSGIDDVPYVFDFNITTGQTFAITFPVQVNAEFIVIRFPNTEPNKNSYTNPPIDAGPIPGFALNSDAFGSFKYVFSRTGNPFTLNSSLILTLNN